LQTPRVKVVIDLGFGDSGKGALVDFLTREFSGPVVNVRFNGGAQAAHNVVLPDGRHHTFAQFGSGSFVPDTITYLAKHVLFDPVTLLNEAAHLDTVTEREDSIYRIFIHPRCKVVTPYHKAINRIEHILKQGKIGSCGMGIAPVMLFESRGLPTIYAEDLHDEKYLRSHLGWIKKEANEIYEGIKKYNALRNTMELDLLFSDDHTENFLRCCKVLGAINNVSSDLVHLSRGKDIVMEGAQGVLLDENFGFDPYTTWSTCTERNAIELLRECGIYSDYPTTEVIGIIRSYLTRHGAGPFPTCAKLVGTNEKHNGHGKYQGEFREGWPDMLLLRYALRCCTVDTICVSHMDTVQGKVCTSYRTGYSSISDIFPLLSDTGRSYKDVSFEQFRLHGLKLQEIFLSSMPILEDCTDIIDTIDRETGYLVHITGNGPTFEGYKRIRRADTSPI